MSHIIIILCLFATSSASAADYFLTPTGDDALTGTSVESAWRSIVRVNATTLRPGDRVLFQSGARFEGHLHLTAEDAGKVGAPVSIASFGKGRATIVAGQGVGIQVESAGHIVISDLIVEGSGASTNSAHGILCDNQLGGFQRLSNLRIEDVSVKGFGLLGILITGKRMGYEQVRVSRCEFADNRRGGMEIAGRLPGDATEYAHADVRVSQCTAHDNLGDPDYLANHSGSGIVLYQVEGGVIEQCRAWGNGGLCRSPHGGPVGIWVCESRRVSIQCCESFSNRTSNCDGGGFDLDGGCSECVLQFNFSHDNDGPGLMAYTYEGASHADHGNVIRYNISARDSRISRVYAGLWVRNDGNGMSGLDVYGNLIWAGPNTAHAAYVDGGGIEAHIHHNLFVGSNGAMPLKIEKPSVALRFSHNLQLGCQHERASAK